MKSKTSLDLYKSIRKQVEKELADEKIATRNVLEDLSIEKSKVEIAKAKEEAILLSIGDGLLATDEKGNLTFINKVAEKLLDQKSEKVIGKNFSEVLSMEDERGVSVLPEKRPINMALAGGTTTTASTTSLVYYYVRKDKTKFPVATTVTPVLLDGKMIGAIEIFRDITREKEIDQAKTGFISLASHQLKTPVTAINWLTERLLGKGAGALTPLQKEYFNDIRAASLRMIELVNALLNISRIELGAFAIQPVKMNIHKVIKNALYELQPLLNRKHLVLKENYSPENLVVPIDKQLFLIIISNLVLNAIHYTPENGQIQVTCQRRATDVMISVQDTGCGIPKQQQDKLFTKFFRADNAREKSPDGTGLGLYLVKLILDHSGGLIWFSSQENQGSVFYITIPLEGMRKQTGTLPLVIPQIKTVI
ncbi:MAG: ATP-binding protein [Candidatus Vogelbacteria bacterium]